MNNDQWYRNRLNGDFAESIAMTHFSALGYKVERTGIEHTAPFYAQLQYEVKSRDYDVSAYSNKIFKFHSKFPDFIASRVTQRPNNTPIMSTIFIEVKYRKNVDLAVLREEVKGQYEHYISSGYPIFIYLLSKTITNERDVAYRTEIRPNNFRLFFCYLIQENALWWEAGCPSFDKYPIYKYEYNGRTETFNRVYKDLIIGYLNGLSD
ncbi:hypothetical protein [Rosenbergiella epipactidis]|uniref:hypothetical protein n=1 Tax=Rosenbergiella epipactidis TaxID=1544694 RepID=UPI001F501FD6|nr:hypothetical protein [Rosenbergiella epipactidis]